MPVILAGLGVLIQKALEAAAIGAIIGALFGGAAGGAGGVILGVQEHGTFNSEVADRLLFSLRRKARQRVRLIWWRIRCGRRRCSANCCRRSRWRVATCTRRCR